MAQSLTIEQINSRKSSKNRLTAIEFGEPKMSGKKLIKTIICKCECGVIKQIRLVCFDRTTFSCGCYNKELVEKWDHPAKYDTIERITEAALPDNRLTPIRFLKPKFNKKGYKIPVIECICRCGKKVKVDVYHFVNNKIRSCGCLVIDKCRENFTKYPGNIKQIRNSYDAMMRRCYDNTCEEYVYYGAIGVVVCDEWVNDYRCFLKWAKENGWKKGLEIDKDKNGDGFLYSPQTCEWVTHAENMKYTKRSTVYEYQGEMRTATEIARMNGLKGDKLSEKLKSGMSIEDAVNLTIRNKIKLKRYVKIS